METNAQLINEIKIILDEIFDHLSVWFTQNDSTQENFESFIQPKLAASRLLVETKMADLDDKNNFRELVKIYSIMFELTIALSLDGTEEIVEKVHDWVKRLTEIIDLAKVKIKFSKEEKNSCRVLVKDFVKKTKIELGKPILFPFMALKSIWRNKP